jgi:putative phosphoribosyl transferase
MSGSNLPKPTERQVVIPAGRVLLVGSVDVPRDLRGLVIMAHGTGSTRFSPRNRAMAKELRLRGFGTVLVDLLIDREGTIQAKTFDIELLAERFGHAVTWTAAEFDVTRVPLGFFGASTGAAAALVYAATGDHRPSAVVSRGGRPDLARRHLPQVTAPTLLIVGGADTAILDLNHAAQAHLSGLSKLFIVPGATHFFREPGAMNRVSEAAADWFETYLVHAVKARIELG